MCFREICFITYSCIIILPLTYSSAIAVSYYVDTTNGRDYNSGLSPEKAWKTIKKVKNTPFQPGDVISFKRGEVFDDYPLFIYSSGAKKSPIIYKDYGDSSKPLPIITYPINFCIWMRDIQFVTFQNLEVAGGAEAVIELKQSAQGSTHDITIKDCIIRGANCGVLVDTARGGLIEGCEIYDCGIGFSTHDPGFTVRNCKIYNNRYGISVGTYDTLIEENEIYNNTVGIQYGWSYGRFNTTFRYNLIRDNISHGFETLSGTVDAGLLYYNIFLNNGGDGLFLKNSISGISIYNNIIYSNGLNGINLAEERGKLPFDIVMKNNIIMNNKGYEVRVAKEVAGFVSDYNCVYHSTGGTFMHWSGTGYNWKDWKKHAKQDDHSICKLPSFTDEDKGNFRLKNDSPCINAGTTVELQGRVDYYGNPIPHGKVDIGIHEIPITKGTTPPF